MKFVFVSGPYSGGDIAVNVRRAMDAGIHIIDKGDVPFIPHLFHFLHLVHEREQDLWGRIDLEFLPKCDVILRLSGESFGADVEVGVAIQEGIPVYYSLEELYGS